MTKSATKSSPLISAQERTCLPIDIDTEDEDEHHGSKCYNVTIDFISLVLAVVEIGLVIYLSISHFGHSAGIIALAMLLPILLNFVGVTYFFSNKEERTEFERVGNSRCAKDLFQVPVLGPVFTSIKVLSISSGCSSSKNYARFEASAIKMKQAESFFGAAPEALVQLTVLLVTRTETMTLDNYLEIAVVVVSVLSLAEANMYGIISNYYKLFHEYDCADWKLPHLTVPQKMVLLFHSIASIGSRIAAVSFLKSAIKYAFLGNITNHRKMKMAMMQTAGRHKRSIWEWPEGATPITTRRTTLFNAPSRLTTTGIPFLSAMGTGTSFITNSRTSTTTMSSTMGTVFNTSRTTPIPTMGTSGHQTGDMMDSADANSLAVMVVAVMMIEIAVRMVLFYIARLIKHWYIGKGIPSGCYESIWFYLENIGFFALWWLSVQLYADKWVKDDPFFFISALFLLCTILSIFLLFACRGMELHDLKTPFKRTTSKNSNKN